MQVKKQQLGLDMELVPNWERSASSLYIVTLFNLLQNTSWEMLGWMKHKLESRLPGEITITSDTQMTPPLWEKAKKKNPDESETGVENVSLKLNIQKTKIMSSGHITSWQMNQDTVETVTNFILGGSKITADGNCSHEI